MGGRKADQYRSGSTVGCPCIRTPHEVINALEMQTIPEGKDFASPAWAQAQITAAAAKLEKNLREALKMALREAIKRALREALKRALREGPKKTLREALSRGSP